jgi:N utilization substance protein B
LVELADYNLDDDEEKKYKSAKVISSAISDKRWRENAVIQSIKNNKEYISNTSKAKAVWNAEILRKVYKDLKSDKTFQEYLATEENSFEADKAIALYIVKSLVFKGVYLQTFFEERELNWVENRSIVKNMVLKTIKAFDENEGLRLLSLSANWDDDKMFFEELYQSTVEKDKELETLTSKKIKNWDIERLAALDRIIIVMAISEMIQFPSIPVKVSINEYIELSKLYSTPKSKQFVNGLLDKLSEDLIKKGVIKKSGRGLIDNK